MAKNFWENDSIVQPAESSKMPWESDSIVQPVQPVAPVTLSPEEQMMSSVGEGSGTEFKDIGKLAAASAVKSVLGSPEAVQAAGSGMARDTAFKPTEALNFLADPRQLTNQLAGYVGMKPIFDQNENALIAKDLVTKQRIALDETLKKGKIESLRDVTKYGAEISKMIEDTVSPEMKEALANTEPTGNILKALDQKAFGVKAGDNEISFGKAPSAQGLFGQAARVFGSAAPGILTSFITKSATPGAVFGFGQAGGEAIETAREHIAKMSDVQLAKDSEYYRNLIVLGIPPQEARAMTEEKAADTAAYYQGMVGALGGAFTGNLVAGKFDATKLLNAKNVLTRIGKGTAVGMTEESAQELAEGIATDLGINRTVVREIGVDSFANAVLGAIGGGGPGAVSGALAKPDQPPPPPPPGAVPPVADATGQIPPPAPPTIPPTKMAEITADELEEETPIKKGVTGVTPPAPADVPEEGPLKRLTPAEAAIKRLKPEFQEEFLALKEEAKQIIAKQKELVDQGEDEDPSLDIRLEEIKKRADEFYNDKQYRKPLFEKAPNDPAIEKEALALADELEKVGDTASSNGLRTNLSNKGGYTDPKKLDYYKGKLLEAQQKVGVAEEMPKETVSMANYMGLGYETDAKRVDEFLNKPTYYKKLNKKVQASQEVRDIFAKSNEYLQKITDRINELGYTANGQENDAPKEVKDLRIKLSQIAGSTNRLIKEDEGIIKELKLKGYEKRPQQRQKSLNILAKDFAEVDSLIGKKVEEEKPKTELQKLMDIEERLESPTISKTSVIPHATVMVAPYKDGFVSSYQYYGGGKSQLNISTPLDLKSIYPTRKEAIDAAAQEIRERAEVDKNKVALTWLDTVSTPAAPKKTQAEINRERQAEKKAVTEKPAEKIETISFDVPGEKGSTDYYLDANGVFTREDTVNGEKDTLTFVTKDGAPEWVSNTEVTKDNLKPITKNKQQAKQIIAKERAFVEQATKEEQIEVNKARQSEKKAKVEEKKPKLVESKEPIPKLDESWAEYRKEPLTSKPSDMSQEVFDKYQDFQKGDFPFTKVSFTGANALARANAANKERKAAYDKAAYTFLSREIKVKFPTKNQPKLEIPSLYVTPYPIAKNIKAAKTLEDQKKAILTIAAPKDELRKMLQGVLVEPNKLVVTDGHRIAIYNTDTGVSERTLLDKDNKVIDMPYVQYERIADKAVNPKMYGMVNATALGNYARGVKNAYRYVSAEKNSPFNIQFKNGEQLITFNGRYIEDMANVFRQFGYEGFNIGHNDGGMLVAVSPDGKLTQYVMSMRRDDVLFQPFNVENAKPGATSLEEKPEEEKPAEKKEAKVEVKEEPKVEKAAVPKLKGTTDEDGFKVTAPMLVELNNRGYEMLHIDNPRTYKDKNGEPHRTMEKDGVRVAFDGSSTLFLHNGRVNTARGGENDLIFYNLQVDPDKRKQGLAKQALKDVTEIANQNGLRVYLEPVQLEKNGMTKQQLSKLYSEFGFEPKNEAGSIMVLKPQEKQIAKEEKNTINQFVSNLPALRQTKVKNDLLADINYKGEVTSRADLIQKLVNDGRKVIEIEYKKPITKTQEEEKNQLSKKYIVGASNENLPGVKRLKELQDIAKNGNVTVERVLGTKELHLAQDQITKTGMDYAQYLIDKKALPDESRTIDVEATEITEEQIMLLSDETSKLSKKEMDTLENYYGFDSSSSEFFKMLRDDIVNYVNKGANAVDEAIRDIIKKLQAGVLAVAVVFNPAYMSEQSAVIYPAQTVTQQVMAAVPDSAKGMSEGAKKAYATLYPALQKEMEQKNKYFTVVDKPKSKVYVFNPDGSLLTQSNVVLGKALGDVYVGKTQFKENQITPAGLIKAKAEKGSATYDGKTVYTFGNVKEGWNAVFMHTVYLKESDAEARKRALATGEDTRLSHGCVNGPAELMAKIDNDSMDGSHVFIVPDNQTMVDDYIANNVSNEDLTRETVTPVTKTTQVPAKGAKSIGAIDIVGREEEGIIPKTQAEINRERQLAKLVQDKPYYNDFTNDFTREEFDANALKIREENIKEYAKVRAATRREIKKVAKVGSDINVQRNLNELLAVEEALKDTLDATKVIDNRAIVFRNRANDAEADGSLAPEVAAVIDQIYKRFPGILEGLKLSVRENKDPNSKAAGNFNPYVRMVTLWKGSSGVENPSTVRHELVHSLEQMMTPETKKAVVEAWAKSFQAAIKANPDAKSQAFFNKVMDFLEDPSRESFDAATKIMPNYDYYQYMNPSEFWAVNAEKMFAAKLGTPWAKFVNAIKKLFEALKSVFGFNNKYALHKAFDNIINGTLERTNKKKMLTDYLFNGKVKLDFLNNIEEIAEENENVPEVPDNDPKSFKEMMIGTYGRVVENAANIGKNPKDNSLKALDKASEGILYTRIKNFWFGAGLEARDLAKYNGLIRTAEGLAVASLAVKNAIHAGSIATQVLIQGGLEYSADFMQFIAVKRDYSMKNVAKLQYEMRKKLGRKEGDKTIQAYLVASRSRGIYNTYLEAQAKMEMAIDAYDNAARAGNEEGRTKAYNEMQDADRALEQAIIAYQKIPTYLRQLDEEGETIYETVEDRKGNEYQLPVLNDEEIDKFIDRENDYPQLAKILENFTAVNHEMIDNMVKSSRISAQEGARLKKMKGYVPWNRVMDEQEELFDNRRIPSMPSNIKYFKKGETDREIGNIIENMNHNVTMMTRSAIRNYAQVRIVQEYARRKENGKLQLFPAEGRFESGVRVPVFIAGQRRIVEIPDAMVAEAILGMIAPPYEIPMQKLLGAAAQLVRRTVTFSAYFQLKQVFYDAPTAAWVSGVRNPLAIWTGAFSGFVKAVNPASNDPVVQILKSSGVGGFQSYHRTAKKEQDIEFGMIKRSAFAYVLKVIDHIGDSSDYAQRIATYNQVFKETGDKALALMQAADVIDFQKHGNGRLAQALRVSVTFMQAYATQLDVLTQAMVGGNLKGQSRLEAAAKFHATGVAMASLMVLWAMMSCGDDDYHELDDDVKARNLYVPYSKKIFGNHILIPLRSTAAMFYKVMPELIYYDLSQKGTKNEMDKTRFWKASGNAAVDMLLGPTPIPSAFKGAIEISLDRNFYTGGDITPNYLKKLEASRQFTASTSELGKIFSAATQIPFTAEKGKENKRVLSPIQADHLMRSLGGSLASVSMYFTNLVFNSDRPSTQLKENPLLGGLVGADVARRNESLFYDLKERTDKVYGTFQDLIKNDRKKGTEYREDNIKMIQAYGYTSGMAQNLATMNKQIRRLSRSEDLTVEERAMTPEQKRERINFFNQKKQDILKDVIERRKMAGL